MTITNRIDFIYLFDAAKGNPNGDPDADNAPRIEADTGLGLVSDVCLKRKVRNYVQLAVEGDAKREPTHGIYIREGSVLDETNAHYLKAAGGKDAKAASKALMQGCWDARTFGAVMVGDSNLGTQRGPVQLTFARSILPVIPQRHSITRCAATREELKKDGTKKDNKTMGGKWAISHAVYRAHGYVSAPLAAKTGCGSDDLELLWEALVGMWDQDRSASRGEIAPRGLILFEHSCRLGNCPAHQLFEAVDVVPLVEQPTSWRDYRVTVGAMPDGVKARYIIDPREPQLSAAAA